MARSPGLRVLALPWEQIVQLFYIYIYGQIFSYYFVLNDSGAVAGIFFSSSRPS